jgi:hypothetical protein
MSCSLSSGCPVRVSFCASSYHKSQDFTDDFGTYSVRHND